MWYIVDQGKNQIKGSSRHNLFQNKIVSTCHGSSITLIYPEGVLFPLIHWEMSNNNFSALGCLPVPLLTE